MRILQSLKRTIELLTPWEGSYAICGGVAACLYRETPRYTGDIDIAIIDSSSKSAHEIAETVLKGLGYEPIVGFVTNHRGELMQQVALVVGREADQSKYSGIDFLLPVLDWVEPAVRRAQHNKLDFGFAQIASLTPEDLIVAKLFALQGAPERTHDLDEALE